MSRRQITVTGRHGRDKGKTFVLTEMDAFSCEEWARGAISAVYRAASASDQGILSLMSESIREAFMTPDVPDVSLPTDGSIRADDPIVANVRAQLKEDAEDEARRKREDAPSQMAAVLGLRLFFQLPSEEQRIALRPLLQCVAVRDPFTEKLYPMTHQVGGGIEVTEAARKFVEEPQTIALLESEAFRLHTDFFTPAARLMSERLLKVMQPRGPQSGT